VQILQLTKMAVTPFDRHNRKSHTACKRPALSFIELELLPTDALRCGNRKFRACLLLWPLPWSNDFSLLVYYYWFNKSSAVAEMAARCCTSRTV